MKDIIEDVLEAAKGRVVEADVCKGCNNEVFFDLAERDFETVIHHLSLKSFELVSMYCIHEPGRDDDLLLHYAFEKNDRKGIVVFRLRLRWPRCPSIDSLYPSASWYQREISDGFGIEFLGAYDDRRLLLHENYPEGFHPLLKTFQNKETSAREKVAPEDAYQFRKVEGEGVYEIPVGPVHAGIIEPGHFRFSVIGETVYNLEIRMFYKHRGIEKLSEGKTPEECVGVAESISGDETVANAAAYCGAIEKICDVRVPDRAWHLRTIFLELERIYSLLGDVAGMCIDVAFPVGASPFFILREEILRKNKELTGSRFMKDAVCIGGVKRDVDETTLKQLSVFLEEFEKTFKDSVKYVKETPSAIDRFERTGVIRKELLSPLHITGPAARASGCAIDTRLDHPYGIYDRYKPAIKTLETGDVLARFDLKAGEILDSADMIRKLVKEMPQGKIAAEYKIIDGGATSLVESPRGQSFHWVTIRNGTVYRYKIRTASFCNWQAIEHAVIGNIVPDFPLINKSLNLSYAGTDL